MEAAVKQTEKLREALNLLRVPDLRGPPGSTRLMEPHEVVTETLIENIERVIENRERVARGERTVLMSGIHVPVGDCGFFCDERGFATRVPERTPGTYR